MLYAPLEQFKIIASLNFNFFYLDFSITNFLIINIFTLFFVVFIIYFNSAEKYSFYFIANSWQYLFEFIITIVFQLISEIITKENEKFIPVLLLIFNYILFSNLIGLIPYSFTTTSHLIITFYFSFSIFIALNIMIINKYKFKFFCLFLPSNTLFILSLILVPIEFVSYIAKPISLGVRLFINLMAGHTLLKVIIGFSWNLLVLEDLFSLILIIPILILIILFGLELCVAFIQTYVFIILTSIYIQDGI